jgi:hypothetical protein
MSDDRLEGPSRLTVGCLRGRERFQMQTIALEDWKGKP